MAEIITPSGSAPGAPISLRAHHLDPIMVSVGDTLASAGLLAQEEAVMVVRQNGSPESAVEAALSIGSVPMLVYGLGSGRERTEVFAGPFRKTDHALWLTAVLRGIDGTGAGPVAVDASDQVAASLVETARYIVLAALGRNDSQQQPSAATGDVLAGGETLNFSSPEDGLFMHAVSLRIEALIPGPTRTNPTPTEN